MSCSVHSKQSSNSLEKIIKISRLACSALRLLWNHQAYLVSSNSRARAMSFIPVSQTMALPHGDLSVNQDFVGVMDNPVQNGLCNSAAFLRIRMQPLVPVSRLVLGAEDHRAFITPCLNHFQQVITFLGRQTSDQPFIQNQKIILLVALNGHFREYGAVYPVV